MKRSISNLIFFLLLFAGITHLSFSQTTTVTFNEITTPTPNSLNGTNTYDNTGVRFQIFSGGNPGALVSSATGGFGGTRALDDTNTVEFGVTGWKITKVNGTAFQLLSIWLQNGCLSPIVCSGSGTIKAYSGGLQVGSTVDVNFDSNVTGAKNFAANPDFYNVDEIRIEGADIYIFIDNFSFGPAVNPVDSDPPLVTSVSLVGSPLTNATSVNYSVTFSKDAKNVSSDDFLLTTAGTTGTVGAVSGSGSSYTVAVNNLDGEGTIRLDLKGGTNIANVDDITGTPAFTSGQLHYVGPCFVETFETETDASKTFNGNGVNFSLGTGFEIEKRTGFGSGKSNGYIKNNNTVGSFSLSSGSEFTMSTIDLFLSDQTNGDNPTGTGSIAITGKKGGVDQYTITKNSGFPTTTVDGGFFTINFSTAGASNYRNINVDELVFTISGGFIELLVDNMNFCEAAPDVDNQAPVVQSISKTGTSLSTAGTVNFQVTFDEDASNVTLDDFTLLKTGTATGALTGISGSGSIYTLSVTGISGEGSVQIKLNAGTNIQDALGNTPPFEYLNGEIHLVGACYIETFESFTNGATFFSSNGKAITLGGNWAVRDRTGFGINSSSNYLENSGTGTYTLSLDIPVKFSKLALFLTSNTGTNPLPTNDGTVTIRGKNGANTEYTISKTTGFPTDFSSNQGFFYIDFATEGGADNSTTFVDGLEIEIGGSFIYLALDDLQLCGDFDAPTGYSATINQDPIREKSANAASFTFADAEIGTTYNYTFSSDGGGTNIMGSGIIASATYQITGIDLSGLGVGTVTLSVTLTDPSGNIGDPAIDTKQKIANIAPVATAPTAPAVTEDDVAVALADDIQVADGDGDDQTLTFTITGGTVTLGTTGITFGGSGNGSASFTAAGTLAAINTALDAATFTPTPGLLGADAGIIAFVANDGLVNSNSASVTFDIGPNGPTESSLITVSRSSGEYDGNLFEATGEATGLDGVVLSPAVTFEYQQFESNNWSGIAGAPTDVGDYRVRSNFAGNAEYIAGSSDWTAFAINKIAATITVTRASGDYNGNPFEATGSAAGLEGVLSPAVTFEYEQYDGSNWAGIAGAPTDAGAYRVRSNFAGNTNYTSGSSDWTAFAINKIAATITVTRASGDYNGNPFEATGSATGLEGVLSPAVTFEYEQYDGSNWAGIAGAPTDAGAYRVRSNFAGNTNYTSGSSDWTAFAINQIAATITVTRASGDYNGNPFEATGSATGLEGDLNPPVTFEYEQYDGSNWSGIAGAPTDAGAYRVRSNFAGNTNYTSGSSDWTAFAINQIAATITVTRASGDYNGNPFEATGSATGLEGDLNPPVTFEYEQYDGSNWAGIAGAPTDAGAYRVRSNFAGNTNYTSGSSDWTAFAINQIAATITVTRASGDYNGNPFEATGSATGLEGDLNPPVTFEYEQYDGSNWSGIAGAPTDAGAYRVRSNFAGNTNYTSGSSDWTAFAINQIAATITVTRASGDYNGNPFEATGSATGLEGDLNPPVTFEYEQYDGSNWAGIAGAPTDAGAYRVRSNFAGNTNYTSGSSDWTAFAINQIAATITVTRASGDYNGNPFEATGSAAGLEGDLNPPVTFEYEQYDGSNWAGIAGAPTDAGAYRVRSNFAGNTNYTSGSSDWTAFAINQIAATITVTRASGDYNGNPFEATGSATGLEGDLNPPVTFEYEQYDGSNWAGIAGAPTDAGAYRVRSNFAGNAEYIAGYSDWTAFAINKINATIAVTGYSGTYDAIPHGATGSVTGLAGEILAGLEVGASFTNVPGGTANWMFTDVTGNYNDDNGSVVIEIIKAPTTITTSNSIANCDGEQVTLTATVKAVNTGIQSDINSLGGVVTFKTGSTSIGTVNVTSVTDGVFSGAFTISLTPGLSYPISAEFVPNSGNLSDSQTQATAQLTVFKAFVSSSIPKNANGNVVIFDGAESSLGLPSSTTLTATYQPSPYSGLSYKWYERNEGGSFTLISGSNSSTYQIVANGDFVKEYKVELIIDGKCVGNEIFSKVISVESSCGKAGQNKVQICQIMPNGKRKTICVSANAVEALLAGSTGSFIGNCNATYRMEEEPELIAVTWNTPIEVINDKIFSQSENWFDSKKIKLTINFKSYNALQPGFYKLKVNVQENEWFELEEPITVNVLVADKPLATDIQLSNSIMRRDIKDGSVIGDLRTIDSVDDQHTYSIAENSDFDLAGNSLIWKGTAIPLTARVTVFSTDRAGQTIGREIELSREPRFGDFNMFPNPAESDVTLEVELDQTVNVGIRIFDAVGRLVYEEDGIQSGNSVYQINIGHLSSGLYTVQVQTGELVMNKRLIKK